MRPVPRVLVVADDGSCVSVRRDRAAGGPWIGL